MRRSDRAIARVHHLHRIPGLGAAAVREVAGEDPRMAARHTIGGLAIYADFIQQLACRRAIRSSVEGCVENSRMMLSPVKGLMMNMCAVEGVASIGMRFE